MKNLETKLLIESILVGILAGIICVFYRYLLLKAESFYFYLIHLIQKNTFYMILIPILFIFCGWIISKFLQWEPDIGGSGIPQVEAELNHQIQCSPIRIIIAKISAGFLGVFCGLSLGRGAPSVQLGAMSGKLVSRHFKNNKFLEKYLITCGASAGLAATFNAPLASIVFSIEEIHKTINRHLLMSTMCACVIADLISGLFMGIDSTLNITISKTLPFPFYVWIILLGIFCGIFGTIYNKSMLKAIELYSKVPYLKNYQRVFIPIVLSIILGLSFPLANGGGSVAIQYLNEHSVPLSFIFAIFIIRFLFSVLSFGSGTAGGIFYPMLVLGALFGGCFGKIALACGVDSTFFVNFILLGTAAFFSSIVRAPITATILVAEMTGTLQLFLSLILCSFVSYAVGTFLKTEPIYKSLLHNLLKKRNIEVKE